MGGNKLNESVTQGENNVENYHITNPKRSRTAGETTLAETRPTNMQTDGPTQLEETENTTVPKNLNVASIQGGARLSL